MTDDPTIQAQDAQYWEEHWDKYSQATRLNPAQIFRGSLVLRLLERTMSPSGSMPEPVQILDVGCGSGDMLVALRQHFTTARLAGVDHAQSGLDVTQQKIPDALLVSADLTAGSTPASEFRNWASHAVCSEVLEHMADPVDMLKNLQDYLQPGGKLIITVPGGPKSAFDRSIGHIRHYTPALITRQLEQAGYTVDLAVGAGFPTFNFYRLVVIARAEKLSDDIKGKPSMLARLAMGIFRVLLRFSLFNTPWGWQIVAIAHKPEHNREHHTEK